MKDVMLDFETLGNGTNKCLCQVGAVYFDRVTGELGKEFKANIDAASHEAYGGRLDASTVYWWLSQSKEAQDSILAQPREDIMVVMSRLNDFLSESTRIWSHATFDFVTLMETMKQLSIKPSFARNSGLDLRTLVYLSGLTADKTPRTGLHHDGLEDAKHQVKYCVAALNAVKANKQIINFISKVGE